MAWSFAGRSQVAWLGAIAFGVLFLIFGLMISLWYLVRVRPVIAAVEAGNFRTKCIAQRFYVECHVVLPSTKPVRVCSYSASMARIKRQRQIRCLPGPARAPPSARPRLSLPPSG